MPPVKLALIGIGGFGTSHIESLQRLRHQHMAELVAVADPALGSLEKTVHALKQENVRCFTNHLDLLEQTTGLEAVIICTPIHLHKEMVCDILGHGLHVYLEKPPVILLQDLRELIAMDRRRRVAVGFLGVVPGIIHAVKRKLLSGAIGRLRGINVGGIWPRPSWYYERCLWAGKLSCEGKPVFDGPATNAFSHYVHLASWLAGDSFADHAPLEWLEAELYRVRPIESYDTCSIRGNFKGGVTFHAGLAHACQERLEVTIRLIGTAGTATIDFNRRSVSSSLAEEREDQAPSLDASLGNFIDGIRLGAPFRTTLEDCIPFLQIINGMWHSSGGIHPVDSSHYSLVHDEPDTVYDLRGVFDCIRKTVEDGRLFSECGAPWAVSPRRVSVEDLDGTGLAKALTAQPPIPSTQGVLVV